MVLIKLLLENTLAVRPYYYEPFLLSLSIMKMKTSVLVFAISLWKNRLKGIHVENRACIAVSTCVFAEANCYVCDCQ